MASKNKLLTTNKKEERERAREREDDLQEDGTVLTTDVCLTDLVADISSASPLGETRLDVGRELCLAPCSTTIGENLFASDTAPP